MIRAKGFEAKRRARKSAKLKRDENANKEQVREREGHRCRFPWCDCHRWNLFLEVSHREHKGMGGDPTGEKSLPEKMLLVCNWRHKESRYSIDKKTLRAVPLTDQGTNGPVAWEARIPWLLGNDWVRFAVERWAPGQRLGPNAWEWPIGYELVEMFRGELQRRFR